jgi:cis-L-3-hydroxyproline dehydratase
MVLDESVASLEDVLEIHRTHAADGLRLKISRLGGVTKTRQIRDVAVDLGFMITVQDNLAQRERHVATQRATSRHQS